jgi:16S rRNA (guanine1207-N2)-methyltransferase
LEHYYTSKPNTPHDLHRISYKTAGRNMEFLTDAGVFSKFRVDFGSDCLIRSLPKLKGRVLDMGCGYGVIGLSIAAANPDSFVEMADINQRAVELAKNNIELNRIKNARVFLSNGFSELTGPYDTIVSNPPIRAGKRVIYPIFEQSIDYLNPLGEFYIVIQKKQGASSALKLLQSVYGSCEVIKKEGGYWILRCKKLDLDNQTGTNSNGD